MKKHFKKIIFILALLFISYGGFAIISGDPYIYIGSSRIRSDEDSSRIRFNKKIARDYNVSLFDYNTNQFTWSTSNGLTLYNIGDSLPLKILYLYKDTTFGENTFYKAWKLKRDFFNQNDSTVLLWSYFNSQYNTSKQFYVINNYDQCTEDRDEHTLTNNFNDIYVTQAPHDGMWRLEVFFDYEFEFGAVDAVVIDSIYIELRAGREVELAHYVKTYVNQLYGGERGTGYISAILGEGLLGEDLRVRALGSHNGINHTREMKRSITYLRVNLELIH